MTQFVYNPITKVFVRIPDTQKLKFSCQEISKLRGINNILYHSVTEIYVVYCCLVDCCAYKLQEIEEKVLAGNFVV